MILTQDLVFDVVTIFKVPDDVMFVSERSPLNLVFPISKLHTNTNNRRKFMSFMQNIDKEMDFSSRESSANMHTFGSAPPSSSINLNQIFLDSLRDINNYEEDSRTFPLKQRAINRMCVLQTSTDYHASEQAFNCPQSSNLPDVVDSSLLSLHANQNLSRTSAVYDIPLEPPRTTIRSSSCSIQPHCGNVYVNQIQHSAFFSSSLHNSAFQLGYGPTEEQSSPLSGLMSAQNADSHLFAFPQVPQIPPPNVMVIPSPNSIPQGPPSYYGSIAASMIQSEMSCPPPLMRGNLPHYHSLTSRMRTPFSAVEQNSVTHCGAFTSDISTSDSIVPYVSQCQAQPPHHLMRGDNHFYSRFSHSQGAAFSNYVPPVRDGHSNTGTALHYPSVGNSVCHNAPMDSYFDEINDNVSLEICFRRRKRGRPSSNSRHSRQLRLESEFEMQKRVYSKRYPARISNVVNANRRIFHYSSGRMISLEDNHESQPLPIGDSVSAIRTQMSLMKSACSINHTPPEILQSLGSVANRSLDVCNTMDLSIGHRESAIPAKTLSDIDFSAESTFGCVMHDLPIFSASDSQDNRSGVASVSKAGYDVLFGSDDSSSMIESVDHAMSDALSLSEKNSMSGNDSDTIEASLITQEVSPPVTSKDNAQNDFHAYSPNAVSYSQKSGSLNSPENAINTLNIFNQSPSPAFTSCWDATSLQSPSALMSSTEKPIIDTPLFNGSSDESDPDATLSQEYPVSNNMPTVENSVNTVSRLQEKSFLGIANDLCLNDSFDLEDSDALVMNENGLVNGQEMTNPRQTISHLLSTSNDGDDQFVTTPPVVNGFMLSPGNLLDTPSYDLSKKSLQNLMDIPSLEVNKQSPRNLLDVPSYDHPKQNLMEVPSFDVNKQSQRNLDIHSYNENKQSLQYLVDIPSLDVNQQSPRNLMDIPSYLVHRAFDEGRYGDVFQIIRENVFPDEQKPCLRRIWSKALVYSYARVTSLPVTDRQKTIIGQQNPVPYSIMESSEMAFQDEEEVEPFEIITVE